MSGSWELVQQKTCLVGILHTDLTSIAWALGLRNLQIPGFLLPVAGMPFDMARNVVCMKAIETGVDFCCFLDSDVIPPRDAYVRLMKHNLPIVSGIYHRRSPPHGIPVMLRGGQWITEYPANSLIEVDLVGAGCLCIRRDVLEKMPPQEPGHHWFNWTVDRKGNVPEGFSLSEDFTFNVWARHTLGVKTMVDTSIICRHVGLSDCIKGQMVPCSADPNT